MKILQVPWVDLKYTNLHEMAASWLLLPLWSTVYQAKFSGHTVQLRVRTHAHCKLQHARKGGHVKSFQSRLRKSILAIYDY